MMATCVDDPEFVRALLELKIGTPYVISNQYQTNHNRIFSHVKEFDSGCCLAAGTFDPKGGRPIWLDIIFISSTRVFHEALGGGDKKSDSYTMLYILDKDDDEKKGGIDVKFGKTTQAVIKKLVASGHALVWYRSKSDGFGVDVGKKAMNTLLEKHIAKYVVNSSLRIDRSVFATTAIESTRGNLGEVIVNTIIDQHTTHKFVQATLFAGSPEDTKLDNGKTIQMKTITNTHEKSSQQIFPIHHKYKGEKTVPYTLETCQDVVCAVRHVFDVHGKHLGFHEDWNAPDGTVTIVMVFTRDELVNLGKLGNVSMFYFRAGEHLAHCVYVMKDGELFDDSNVNLAKFD
jgi:hypothetical protein